MSLPTGQICGEREASEIFVEGRDTDFGYFMTEITFMNNIVNKF